MARLSEASDRPLLWVQMKAAVHSYQLRTEDGETIARLRLEKTSGTLAAGQINGESWTFKRVGFFNPRVTIRQSGSDANMALYEPRFWGDGVLRFEDGHEFKWRSTNFWSTQWAFMTPEELTIFTFRPAKENGWKDIFTTQAAVEITTDGRKEKNLGLLLLFGWYLVIMHEQETATGAAVATCS